MVMKKKNSRSNSNKPFVRFPPKKRSGYCSRWPLRQGGPTLRILTTHPRARDVKIISLLANLVAAPKRSVACFSLKCGVRSTITPFQNTQTADSRAPACPTPPHTSIACYFTKLSHLAPPVIDWTAGHCSLDKPFFFLLFLLPFTNTQFDQLQGAISTCTPLLYALDDRQTFIHTKCFLLFLSDSALLVRARRSFGVLSACCHTLLSSTRA